MKIIKVLTRKIIIGYLIECQFCKSNFILSVGQHTVSLRKHSIGTFCSKECRTKSKIGKKRKLKTRLKITGENHPNWKNGRSRQQARKVCYRTYKKECTFCGERNKRIIVHHIDQNSKNNEQENLQYLCDSCHRTLHNKL